MSRLRWLALGSVVAVAGCGKPHMDYDPMQKPAVPSQMKMLDRFVGTWSGTAEFVKPTAEEMKKAMGDKAGDMPMSMKGGMTTEWDLGGMALKSTGWHEMGPDTKGHYMEIWTWNAKTEKFNTFFCSDWGEVGTGEAWFDADGNTIHAKWTGRDGHGTPMTGTGTMTFVGNNTVKWDWTGVGAMGKMEMKGTMMK